MSLFRRAHHSIQPRSRRFGFERLELREMFSVVTQADAKQLLDRAVASNVRNNAIVAVVDRNGNILGVRVESGVFVNPANLDFAIDGAVAEARTAAYFSNNGGPGTALTSRTIRQISQTTIAQREVQSDPNSPDPTVQGPGLVAPIGLGGHFPPLIAHTPPVDLFDIESSNRAVFTSVDASGNFIAYNIPEAAVGAGLTIPIPFSYEQQTTAYTPGTDITVDNNRGIATMPGGIPLFKNGELVGGIGVFFPGANGQADYEQGFDATSAASRKKNAVQRENSALALEAEWMAFAATGGSSGVGAKVGSIAGIPPVPGYDLPLKNNAKIFLAGISLDQVGQGSQGGVKQTLATGKKVNKRTSPGSLGIEEPVTPGGAMYKDGVTVSDGWLVPPRTGTSLTAGQVHDIIHQAIDTANDTRAQIRLPAGDATARMVFSVTDTNGNVLGLYRMSDSTVFSFDIAVGKARNDAYYASADLQNFDRVHVGDLDTSTPYLPLGTAFTNRTFRFLAEPRYPAGVDGSVPGAFSILRESWIDPKTALNKGAPVAATSMTTVLGYDAFNAGTNFHDPNDPENQNGVIFFPGSSPLYSSHTLVGGFGVSGDGVDQDDVVAFFGAQGFAAPNAIRADQYFVRGTRLPYQKFSRNPFAI